jgi:dephospho-CoA kinase
VHVFGLTGGIASGKSTVAKRFRERGVPVIDADQVAREVVKPGTEGLAAIVRAFGNDVLLPSGELDRKALGARVFSDPALRATLNQIVHPRVSQLALEYLSELRSQGAPVACYEVPLLFENRLEDGLRPVVLVFVAPEVQRARLISRDHCTEAEADARILAQMPLTEKRSRADITVENNGTVEDLRRNADRVLDEVFARSGVTPLPTS